MNVRVPYALFVPLETAEPLANSIYSQVEAKLDAIRAPLAVPVATVPQL
jgi:hypothetical protein